MSERPIIERESIDSPGVAESDEAQAALGQVVEQDRMPESGIERSGLNVGNDLSPEDLEELGWSQWDRFRRLREQDDLEEAIENFSRALALTPNGHPNTSRWLGNLGVAYTDRFRLLGEFEDLEKSIDYHSHAVALTPDDDPDKLHWLSALGVCYTDRFRRLGELEDLERSIEYFSRVLELTPDDHPNLPRYLGALGVAYNDRFQRLGEFDDLEKAIKYKSQALALTSDDHPDLPSWLAGLGVSYTDRFRRLDKLEDLEKSIQSFSRALALTPDGHPDLPHRLDGLGMAYRNRFQRLGEPEDLQESLELKSRAVSLTPDDHPALSRRLTNLGVSYADKFRHLGDLKDLEKAIDYFSRSITVTPDGHPDLPTKYHNRARACFIQYEHTGEPSHLENSLDSFRSASQLFTGAPRNKIRYALHWATLAVKHSSLNPIEAYQTAIDLLPQFIWLGAPPHQRYQDLAIADSLAVNAASAAILSSNYPLALEWLEHARCVIWNQSLMLRSPVDELHSVHPDLATRLQAAASQLHNASSEAPASQGVSSDPVTPEQASQQRLHLANEYHRLLTEAREKPGFEDFLQPTKASNLVQAARNGPIVVVNCNTERCDAIIISPSQDIVHSIPLPKFSYEKAQRARSEMEKSLGHKGLRALVIRRDHKQKDNFGAVLKLLWNGIVRPVLEFFGYMKHVPTGELPHITWCPTGVVSFLPLHAAGDYDQPDTKVFNYVVSSYTPTLTASLSSSPSSLHEGSRVLGVAQEVTSIPGYLLSKLPGTTKELSHLKEHTQKMNDVSFSELVDDNATTTAVLDGIEQHDWVHFACHAHQNVGDPTESGFFLHDGILDLASINRRSFKNKGLAFLSACQTATGDAKLPDEAIHLASGMLMAGYSGVIATMWSVKDEDAPLVADKVYSQLMKHGKVGSGEAGRALHYAVAELRNRAGEKEFGRWVPYIHIGS